MSEVQRLYDRPRSYFISLYMPGMVACRVILKSGL